MKQTDAKRLVEGIAARVIQSAAMSSEEVQRSMNPKRPRYTRAARRAAHMRKIEARRSLVDEDGDSLPPASPAVVKAISMPNEPRLHACVGKSALGDGGVSPGGPSGQGHLGATSEHTEQGIVPNEQPKRVAGIG